jgi:hypothetical protein
VSNSVDFGRNNSSSEMVTGRRQIVVRGVHSGEVQKKKKEVGW